MSRMAASRKAITSIKIPPFAAWECALTSKHMHSWHWSQWWLGYALVLLLQICCAVLISQAQLMSWHHRHVRQNSWSSSYILLAASNAMHILDKPVTSLILIGPWFIFRYTSTSKNIASQLYFLESPRDKTSSRKAWTLGWTSKSSTDYIDFISSVGPLLLVPFPRWPCQQHQSGPICPVCVVNCSKNCWNTE